MGGIPRAWEKKKNSWKRWRRHKVLPEGGASSAGESCHPRKQSSVRRRPEKNAGLTRVGRSLHLRSASSGLPPRGRGIHTVQGGSTS